MNDEPDELRKARQQAAKALDDLRQAEATIARYEQQSDPERTRPHLRIIQGGAGAVAALGTAAAVTWHQAASRPVALSGVIAVIAITVASLLWIPIPDNDADSNPPVAISPSSAPPSTSAPSTAATPPSNPSAPPPSTPSEPETQQSLPPDVGNDVEPEPQQTGPIALGPPGGGQAPQAESEPTSEPPAEPPNERTESEPEPPEPPQDTPDEPEPPQKPHPPEEPQQPTEPHCDGLVRVDASPLAEVCLLG